MGTGGLVAIPWILVRVTMDAAVGTLLLHVPPAVASDNGYVSPWQILGLAMIATGFGLTVTVSFLIQLVGKV
jgi:hypothetical protein